MKKIISLLLVLTLLGSITLAGCGNNNSNGDTSKEDNVITIGASPVPHEEILNAIKADLETQGIELKIIQFTDYVKPNMALADGEIDANFFQHEPYMNKFKEEKGVDITSLGKVHIEPLGLYSNSASSIEELKDGASIAIPNDPTNGGRALILLQNNGLIKLKEGIGLEATELDIAENPKNFVFKPLEAAQLPRVLDDVDAAVINGNYALEAGLVPTEDAILIEGADSPYANIIAIRSGEENSEKLQALLKALHSDKVKEFIEENYNGGVVPTF
ncbi:MetQ/NlpA family ABC transporter substrate-binding protein [Clostridiisalibacter paucivorans]|uniref:MetQ/NlpA family ABC transporter substrate-binding protein n=1 Tax=Clostridiisalibacter paucivorans TaxID=408753 RepID=UPI0004792889|nr:MetQ/NlpA family ABC transporter substrate-binding protein [Clostridiisalibacter paucivorans]